MTSVFVGILRQAPVHIHPPSPYKLPDPFPYIFQVIAPGPKSDPSNSHPSNQTHCALLTPEPRFVRRGDISISRKHARQESMHYKSSSEGRE